MNGVLKKSAEAGSGCREVIAPGVIVTSADDLRSGHQRKQPGNGRHAVGWVGSKHVC